MSTYMDLVWEARAGVALLDSGGPEGESGWTHLLNHHTALNWSCQAA